MTYSPKDELAVTLLESIPTKTIGWCRRLGKRLKKGYSYKGLLVATNATGGSIALVNDDVVIHWVWNENGFPSEVQTTDERLADPVRNLERFVAVERAIYDRLEEVTAKKQARAEKKRLEHLHEALLAGGHPSAAKIDFSQVNAVLAR